MCGIFGYWDRSGRALGADALAMMAQKLAHRGPDDEGIWHQPQRGVGIGNRRLSIIDIGGGHQPFVSDDGLVAVVQNGEIFNYVELAAELRSQGVTLRTASDTEVILRLYEREGISCLARLNGMFAIAIDDAREDAMYLVRDRIGVKPLYVADDGTRAVFASEIKALLPWTAARAGLDGIDIEAIHHYLSFNYIPAPWTDLARRAACHAGHMDEVHSHRRADAALVEPGRAARARIRVRRVGRGVHGDPG